MCVCVLVVYTCVYCVCDPHSEVLLENRSYREAIIGAISIQGFAFFLKREIHEKGQLLMDFDGIGTHQLD